MSKVNTYACDGIGCHEVRRQTNHWWVLYPEGLDRLVLEPWNEDLAREEHVKHLCGSSCVLKAVATYLGKPNAS